MADLDLSELTAQWLTTGFMLTMAVVIPLTGFLMGRFSTRQVFSIAMTLDRKSTRLNSSHVAISYAVFCLKKKTTLLGEHTPDTNKNISRWAKAEVRECY